MNRAARHAMVVRGCLVALVLAVTVSSVSAETLMMPNRDALKGTPVVVWGVTTLANGSTYTIDFGDSSPVATGIVTDRSYIAVTHIYTAQGSFTASLTVGAETATTQIQAFDATLLTAENLRGLGINRAIQDGLRWLWTAQVNRSGGFPSSTTTSWVGGSFPTAYTSMVVLAFENHGYGLTNNNVAPTGLYQKYVVRRGLNYVFSQLSTQQLTVQTGGNPCVGTGIEAAPCTGLKAEPDSGYSTPVATLAIAGSGALSRTVTEVGGYVAGKTYGEILQRVTNTVAWGQGDSGVGRGSWSYGLQSGGDGSTVGWGVLAMLDAAAAGATVAPWAKDDFKNFALPNALNTSGSLDYTADGNPNLDSSGNGINKNIARTGIALQGLFLTGVVGEAGNPQVATSKSFISARWAGSVLSGDWDGTCAWQGGGQNKGCAYAMFNVFKGLKLHGIATLPGVTRPAGPGSIPAGDWYADYQDWLVSNQTSPTSTGGGDWASMRFSCCDNQGPANAALAELILSPVALVLPDGDKFSTIGLAPPTHTAIEGGNHTVTAHAESTGGSPVPGATVNFTILSGPNAGQTGTGTTDANGNAPFTYADTGGPGTDNIQAFIGTLSSNVVEMIWTPLNQPPVAQCQDVTVAADASCQGTGSVNNGSFDPEGDPITLAQLPAGPFGLAPTSVTLTVTDSHAATSMCVATVTVVDQTPPAITCPATITVAADARCLGSAAVTATATDNCSVGSVNCGPGGPYGLGSNNVSCAAGDGSGNTASCSTAVVVVDQTPPGIACPAPQTVECTSPAGAIANVGAPTAADNCSVASANCAPASGTFAIGTTAVACSAADGSGNSAGCQTSVIVVDTTKPAVGCVPSVNPSGNNIPAASKINEDGFYKIGASDICTAPSAIAIKIGTWTLANGETIKITQARGQSGVRLVNTMGPLQIKHFQVGPGDAVITATDASGNASSVTCLVPPPPK